MFGVAFELKTKGMKKSIFMVLHWEIFVDLKATGFNVCLNLGLRHYTKA